MWRLQQHNQQGTANRTYRLKLAKKFDSMMLRLSSVDRLRLLTHTLKQIELLQIIWLINGSVHSVLVSRDLIHSSLNEITTLRHSRRSGLVGGAASCQDLGSP